MDVIGGVSLGVLESFGHSAERLCKDELCCLRQKRKVNAIFLLYKSYQRVNHPMNEYLNHFVVAHNTRASPALSDLAL